MIKIVLILLVAGVFIGYAYAADLISITRSQTCIITKCVLVKDLVKWDNSTQSISGKFVEKNGDLVRQKGLKNSVEFYRMMDKKILFVEPDGNTLAKSKLLIIHPKIDEYIVVGQYKKTQINSTVDLRLTASGLYADKDCHTVIIGLKQVSVEFGLAYLGNGCPDGKTPFINEHYTNKTKIKYCGNDCQYKKFMADAKKKSKAFLLPFKKELK